MREGTALQRGCNFIFLFLGRALGHGKLVACASCFLSVFVSLLCSLIIVLCRSSLLNELKVMRGDVDQVADVRNRRASLFLPINPLKMAKTNNTRFGRGEDALG